MLTFKVVDNKELFIKSCKFRYRMMFDILHGIEENEQKIDQDEFDKYSIHFVALNQNDEVCANIRLILDSPLGLPMTKHMKITHDFQKGNNFNFAELSRAYIDERYRSFSNSKTIIYNLRKLIEPYIFFYEIDFIYGALEKNFIKFLRMIDINFQIIGEGGNFYGYRYPCIISSKKFLKK